MKKTIIALAAVAVLCGAAAPVVNATPVSTEAAASATTVPVYSYRGHIKTSNKATVESTSEGLMVTFAGQTYLACSSNRDGYEYMFTTRTTTWYFNY